jgi:hypothetical protein
MYDCCAAGEFSVLAPVDGSQIAQADVDEGLVLVHVTVCRQHLRTVRRWLAGKTPGPVDTYSTETLMREWSQVTAAMEDTPIWTLTRAA